MRGHPSHAVEWEADRAARLLSQTMFDRPLVLEAGAGTGKTATLAGRLLAWCLGEGWARAVPVSVAADGGIGESERTAARVLDAVVAITFTEAAAAEMASRIADGLAALAGGGVPEWLFAEALPEDPRERGERAAALLVALDHLKVSTIHAFCRRLLSRHPLEAGLHPSLVMDADERLIEEVVREVVEIRLRDGSQGSPQGAMLSLVASGVSFQELARALQILAGRGVPASALNADPYAPEVLSSLQRQLLTATGSFMAAGGELIATTAGLRGNGPATVGKIFALDTLFRGTSGSPGRADLRRWGEAVREALDDSSMRKLQAWSTGKPTKGESEIVGELEPDLAAAATALRSLLGFLGELQLDLLDQARQVVAPLLEEVEAEVRARGIETFDALLRDAARLLTEHPEVAAAERGEISQLLVDEFQDTDRLQCDLLRCLALQGPGRQRPGLFLVGDPKQSIFGWRNADLRAWEGFVTEVRAVGGEIQSLSVSFRSAPVILAEVERCLAPVMKPIPGVQPAFQRLVPCEKNVGHEGLRVGHRAPVEHWVSWTEAPGGKDKSKTLAGEAAEVEARAVASDMRSLHDDGGVAWQDMALLMRATGNVETYLEALRDEGVPYTVEHDRSYYRRREIVDAAAWLSVVLDPTDHLAMVTWLRSPAVGTPDAALIPLWSRSFPRRVTELSSASTGELDGLRRMVREVAEAIPPDVPGIDRICGWEHSLIAAIETLAELRHIFATEPAAIAIERLRTATLIEVSEAARYLGAFRLANLERFFNDVLAWVEDTGGDWQRVLGELRRGVLEGRENQESRRAAGGEEAVRVLTIHKAKGLDFRCVYLVQTHKGKGSRSGPRTEMGEVDGRVEYRLLGAPTPGWLRVREQQRQVSEAEEARTLYVALTRAKHRLVIAGNRLQSRAGDHERLLRSRPAPDLPALFDRLAREGGASSESHGARWLFPALEPSTPRGRRQAEGGPQLPSPDEVSMSSRVLASHRAQAARRMERPFGGAVSAASHDSLAEMWTERGAGTGEPRDRRSGEAIDHRATAMAAGSLVHQILEMIDMAGDLRRELQESLERSCAAPAPDVPLNLQGGVRARAAEVLERFASSSLHARLAEVAPAVVARELPIYAVPDDQDAGPVGYVSGTIDMVYDDPSDGRLVVVDYKTDEVTSEQDLQARVTAYAAQGEAYCKALQDALALDYRPRFELWFLWAGRIITPTHPPASGTGNRGPGTGPPPPAQ